MVRLLTLTFAGLVLLAGCEKEDASKIAELTVAQVASLLAEGTATVLDANSDETRQEQGVIPGARLLSHGDDIAGELPPEKDAHLVFYCASTRCAASDRAAEQAVRAGYSQVSVLRAGIKGWKEAGQPTQKPSKG